MCGTVDLLDHWIIGLPMRSLNLGWRYFGQIIVVWGGLQNFFHHFGTENIISPKNFFVVQSGAKYNFFSSFQHREHNFTKNIFVVYSPPPQNYKFVKGARKKLQVFQQKREKEGRQEERKKGKKGRRERKKEGRGERKKKEGK